MSETRRQNTVGKCERVHEFVKLKLKIETLQDYM